MGYYFNFRLSKKQKLRIKKSVHRLYQFDIEKAKKKGENILQGIAVYPLTFDVNWCGFKNFDIGQYSLNNKAILDYSSAIRLDSGTANYYSNRGQSYRKIGKPQVALNDFEAALALEPGNTSLFFHRGMAFYDCGLYQKAIKDFQPMQLGDVISTYADTTKLQNWIEYSPQTSIEEGVKEFAKWYLNYFK